LADTLRAETNGDRETGESVAPGFRNPDFRARAFNQRNEEVACCAGALGPHDEAANNMSPKK